jgi:hypothetical protein
MRDRMKLIVLACLVALLAASAASAATPAQYRARVNAICRGYTPTAKTIEADMEKAQASNNYVAWGADLGKLLVLDLAQHSRIMALPVPAALTKTMAPILTRLKAIDRHERATLAEARAGNSKAMLSELLTVTDLAKPLNRQLDAAGLRDCGSNQT